MWWGPLRCVEVTFKGQHCFEWGFTLHFGKRDWRHVDKIQALAIDKSPFPVNDQKYINCWTQNLLTLVRSEVRHISSGRNRGCCDTDRRWKWRTESFRISYSIIDWREIQSNEVAMPETNYTASLDWMPINSRRRFQCQVTSRGVDIYPIFSLATP